MKEFLDKLSSYNLFNYLFPGVVFSVLASNFTDFNFIQSDLITGVFVYYFIGLLISRIGSILIEPLLKKEWSFDDWFKMEPLIKFDPYMDFIEASKKDEKIILFSEVNNTFRSLLSMFFLLLILKLYDSFIKPLANPLVEKYLMINNLGILVLLLILLLVFLFSYKKQTDYITKRIRAVMGTVEEKNKNISSPDKTEDSNV